MTDIYVNNREFQQLIIDYKSIKSKNPQTKIPDSIGKILMLIAQRLSTRFNFNGYTFRDEMVSDGILRAVEVFDNFDPEKSSYPFSYFSKVIFRSFIQRIKREKTEMIKRNHLIMVNEIFTLQEGDDCRVTKDQIIGDFQFDSGDWIDKE